MDNRNKWLVDLIDRDDIWAEDLDRIPVMIKYSYVQLKKLVSDGQVYGVMLQLKDLYESLYKIPIIMTLVVLESDDKYKEGNSYAEVIKAAIGSPMSMGKWDELASVIIKKNKELQLPKDLTEILKRTHRLYGMEVTSEVPDVINWRNDAIGHGALKFEDDESYKNEVKSLLALLKEYFDGESKFSIKGLYDKIYFEIADHKLIGDNILVDNEESLFICVDSIRYNVDNYINNHDLKFFLFDSYYSRKNLIKYSSYIGGQNEFLKNKYFSDLYEKYVLRDNKDFTIQSEVINRGEDIILEYLNMPKSYIKPAGLVEDLVEAMNEIGKGVISIFMERGMGKSAFSNHMSGLYHKVSLIRNSLSRCYHVQNAALRGISDFINSVNFSYRHSYDPTQDLWGSNDDMPSLSADTNNPSSDMANFLNYYHKKYKREFTVLLIDGIDELTEQTTQILDYVPSQVELEEGVFVILLSRFKDENTVIGDSIRYIENAEKKSQTQICFYRKDNENIRVLRECINQHIKDGLLSEKTDIDKLLEKADYRFLYLKAYLELKDGTVLDNKNEYEFIRSYMDHILSFYGPSQKHKLLEIAVTIALFSNISIQKYQEYLCLNDISFEFVGLLNDLLPVITVYHIDGEDVYSFADVAYNEYIISEYMEVVQDVIRGFCTSLSNSLGLYLDYNGQIKTLEILTNELVEKLYKSIYFFSEGILSIWSKSHTYISVRDSFYSNISFVELFVYLADDSWMRIGYGLYLKEELQECMGDALYYCIKHPNDKNSQSWRTKILNRIKSVDKYFNPFERFFRHIKDSRYHSEIYNFLLRNDAKQDITEWYEILKYYRTEDTIELLQKNNKVIEFLDYIDSGRSIAIKDKWLEQFSETQLSSKEEERVLNYKLKLYVNTKVGKDGKGYSECAKETYNNIIEKGYEVDENLFDENIEKILEKINKHDNEMTERIKSKEEAVDMLLDFDTTWKYNNDEIGITYKIYSCIKHQANCIPCKDIEELHSAYYKRLCYELNYGDLSLFIESEILLDYFLPIILKNEFGDSEEYNLNMKKWIDIIKGLPEGDNTLKVLSSMMIERINWLFSHNMKHEGIKQLEYYIYNVDSEAFFNSCFMGNLGERYKKQPVIKEKKLVYCTNNALVLLNYYKNNGLKDKFTLLMKKIEDDTPLVTDAYLSFKEGQAICEIKNAQFLKYRNTIGYCSLFNSYFDDMTERHFRAIEISVEALSRNSNFTDIAFHVELLLEYGWQSGKYDKGIEICNKLTKLFESVNRYTDPVVKQSIEKQLDIIKSCCSFFEFLKDEKVMEIGKSARVSDRSLYYFLGEYCLYSILDGFIRKWEDNNVELYLDLEDDRNKLIQYDNFSIRYPK